MTKAVLSSRERIILTMEHRETDYVPCCFLMFHGLRDLFPGNQEAFIKAQLEMGLDAVVQLPELPFSFHPDVSITSWREDHAEGESYPLLHKIYHTPAGDMETIVRKTDDWPHGDNVEFYDDYNVPRSLKFHVSGKADFRSLKYLLLPPGSEQVKEYRNKCRELKQFGAKNGLPVLGVRGVLVDAAIRLAGVDRLVYAAVDDPDFLDELLEMIWTWNKARLDIILDEQPDFFLRRAWYENMSFWSPSMFKRHMAPYLRKEVALAHEAGAKHVYINTCSYMNLLDDFLDIGFDTLFGIDPVQDRQLDMPTLKKHLQGKICLWGGVNGFVTIERGTGAEVAREVERAFEMLAPGGGFILSPVDNVRDYSQNIIKNIRVFIETWKKLN